jgi:hypothetical protein
VKNRLSGGWGGGGRESRAGPLFPISIRYKRDGVRIRVKNRLKTGKIKCMLIAKHTLQIIKRMLCMRYIILSVCSAFAKDYVAHAEHTLKRTNMRLIIHFYSNHHEPLIKVPKAAHTIFFWLA